MRDQKFNFFYLAMLASVLARRLAPVFAILFVIYVFRPEASAQNNQSELADEYHAKGEFAKAYELYKELASNDAMARLVHKKYLATMLALKEDEKALKHLKKMLKGAPESEVYNVDYGELLKSMGQAAKAEKHYEEYLESIKKNDNRLRFAAKEFVERGLFEKAEKAYLLGRKNGASSFSYELANLFWVAGDKGKMIDEYMDLLDSDENQLNYVENVLQSRLSEDAEYRMLESRALAKIETKPDKVAFNELLVWLYLQEKKFALAFVQSKALDNRLRLEGFNVYDVGLMALEHEDYKTALKIFEYLVEKYKKKTIYPMARNLLVKTKEGYVKNTYPIEKDKILSLVKDYQSVINEIGKKEGAEAIVGMSKLQAFYLGEMDTAVSNLEGLLKVPGMPKNFMSESKLLLGDIYLLKNEPWESVLLYAQVEKDEKEKPLGHKSKLKSAKLSYFSGDFELAKSHLDILKLATSREIANDAMELSLLIQDNLELDTTATNMIEFAKTELLEYQNKIDESLAAYQKLYDKLEESHSLRDEIMMRISGIYQRKGDFVKQAEILETVLRLYGEDIWADEANFQLAKLYEEKLGDTEKAMAYYKKQMTDFPGSVYVVEARKRYRALRGDKL